MKDTADSELVELVKRSDYSAFNELYLRYWKYIYSIAYRKIASSDDAADLTQNVFMEFYDKRKTLVINIPIKNFLRTAMIYKLAKHFRTKGFQEKHLVNFQHFLLQDHELDSSFDTLSTSETELAFEELLALIHQTIEDMPPKMKEVFMMSRSRAYSVNEIAEKLGLSPQTVKNQVSKALDRIRSAAKANGLSTTQVMIVVWLTQT